MSRVKMMRWAAGGAALCLAGMASAQVQAPTTIPGLEDYSLPDATPRALPTPAATPTPVATPTPAARPTPAAPPVLPSRNVAPRPTPTPTASPRAEPRTPTPRPTPAPSPTATPTPAPRSTAVPTAAPTGVSREDGAATSGPAAEAGPAGAVLDVGAAEMAPRSAAVVDRPAGERNWLWPVLIGLLVLAAIGWFLWRRRSDRLQALPAPVEEMPRSPEPITPAPETAEAVQAAPPAPAPVVTRPSAPADAPQFLNRAAHAPAASIALDVPVVSRAGLNMVTATADVTVVVRNTSDVVARGVLVDVRLTSAQPGQDAAIAALFAAQGRPAVPAFDLAPGETKRVRALATVPRDSLTVLQAGGRPMFVPVVAIRAVHAGGQTTSVHALGIERPGQAKLGPIWLDQPSRMFDTVGVRPHNGQW
ncbi:LPXTG cell wall anchor domain-containing protein [Sphingomonas dokdonensis]|uniref:Agglutinin receptor n=1 Tax=Sphingomonas dokdonensis TaxID=344880 RepID=A0A245ZGD2_9SPHN|nr:LPXTG cell wall anchor domain-containing protein [Sphingomonas dokdonensis]OWK28800.1 hypothetical protein SPDO_26350 [Sphingomonas dokdonensis]